jgi:hypothetical protein
MITLKLKKGDIIAIILALVLIVASAISLIAYSGSKDNVVTVRYNGVVVHQMRLDTDETFTMKQENYDLLLGDLTIVVEDGKVWVDEQTSRYDYCELYGPASTKGTTIICAPNYVTITIEGYSDTASDWPPKGARAR